MKKIISFIVLSFVYCAASGATRSTSTPAQKLIQRMQNIQKKGYMYGHQDDPFYGITWDWDLDRSDTYELVGDYPGVMGFELGGIEMGDAKSLDSVPFTRIREEVIKHYERGGIITISWHPRNPLLGTTAWIEKDVKAYDEAVAALEKVGRADLIEKLDNPKNTVASTLPNGRIHKKFMHWMERLGGFLSSLKDKKGNQIPFIFRPYHENTGSWFWWGKDNCTEQQYLDLWKMTQDYINNQINLKDYIVWSYSPSWSSPDALRRYPGDANIQLLGTDVYQWGSTEDFIKNLDTELTLITQLGKEHNKTIALTECGYQNSPDATWWQRVFKPVIEKYQFVYFLPWRNYSKEHFGASKDATTAEDFKAWAKQKNFLFLKDIKKIK